MPLNTLAFDTCFNACSVALSLQVDQNDAIVFHRFEAMQTGQAERLLPMIQEVMGEAGLSLADIDQLAVTTGPGTFTGTRIGVAAAKGLALVSHATVVGLSSLALIARQAATLNTQHRDIFVVVDMRRDEVYAQVFSADGLQEKSAPALMTISQARMLGDRHEAIYIGSGAPFFEALSQTATSGSQDASDFWPDARYAVQIVSHTRQTENVIRPLYLRPPDAKASAQPRL